MVKIFNTATHKKEEFMPLHAGQVRFYGCGPTIYNYAHIGNLRAYVFYDLLNRYLRYKGYDTTFAMNLTDVDDKTIRDSQKAGKSLRAFTDFYADAFFNDCNSLHIKRPDIIIRATEEIESMIELTQQLLDKGFAYKTNSGDVFFKISAFKDYGKMAGIDLSALKSNADGRLADEYEKEDAQDFVLWKAYSEKDGDVVWEAPFGKGRPGWSLECSAMARKYLGQPFDLHVGGIDLIFPHHTNEIAQSECAYGCKYVNYWMHNAHIMVNGQKMSKSLGNFFTLPDLLAKGYTPESIRYEFIKAHYRQTMDFMEENLKGNQTVVDKLKTFIQRLNEPKTGAGWADLPAQITQVSETFEKGLDDDLNMPVALAGIFAFITEVNKHFDALSPENAQEIADKMAQFDTVLAILPKIEDKSLTNEQQALINERNTYRADKNWAKADELKAILAAQGVIIKDTPTGTTYTFA